MRRNTMAHTRTHAHTYTHSGSVARVGQQSRQPSLAEVGGDAEQTLAVFILLVAFTFTADVSGQISAFHTRLTVRTHF